jgi:hypothetical protein
MVKSASHWHKLHHSAAQVSRNADAKIEEDRPNIDSELECSICYSTFKDPVVTPTGHTYCRACIERCTRDGRLYCPHTRQMFRRDELKPNFLVRRIMDALKLPTGVPDRQSDNQQRAAQASSKSSTSTQQHHSSHDRGAFDPADYEQYSSYDHREFVGSYHRAGSEEEEDLTPGEKILLAGGAALAVGGLAWLLKKALSTDDEPGHRRRH